MLRIGFHLRPFCDFGFDLRQHSPSSVRGALSKYALFGFGNDRLFPVIMADGAKNYPIGKDVR
jgi:hypothetical protein